ncbi:MAG TPA: winged helix-turn-helix domain-containing protein [Candidatus Sulfotelmatobacter sp.]|nr:winged helix-turn-helix domain-containing protein [Candidatus Sulfotelmatobacter sp.]
MTDLAKSRVRFGPYVVDLGTSELSKSGVRVKISGQPFQILAALLERPGQLVTREELCKRIWPEDTYVDFGHGLNAAVNKLRDALCDSADDPRYVETLPRRGYRFIAAVERIEEIVAVSGELASTKQVWRADTVWKGSWTEEEWESTVPVKRQTLIQVAVLAAALVLLAFVVTGLWWRWSASQASLRENELRQKENVEKQFAEAEERESSREQDAATPEALPVHVESPVQPLTAHSGHATPRAAATYAPRKSPATDPLDDSALLQLARYGGNMRFFRERPISDEPAILHLDLTNGGEFRSVTPVVAGHRAIAGPQPSPDGTKLVFMAGSTDMMDIWVCRADGSALKQLTYTGRTGTPRWSPDGRWIAFDSDGRTGRAGIYVVSAEGGPIRAVVEDEYNNSVPSWSRDGEYIYFASTRGYGWEKNQVWKVPAAGGPQTQVTQQGGFSAFESMDGTTLYYAKSRDAHPEIWEVPVKGGSESRVSLLHPSTWASWAVTGKGILLLSEYRGQSSELQYFDFATRSVHSLATLEQASFWLAASANGTSIWYSELTDNQARQVFKAGLD